MAASMRTGSSREEEKNGSWSSVLPSAAMASGSGLRIFPSAWTASLRTFDSLADSIPTSDGMPAGAPISPRRKQRFRRKNQRCPWMRDRIDGTAFSPRRRTSDRRIFRRPGPSSS